MPGVIGFEPPAAGLAGNSRSSAPYKAPCEVGHGCIESAQEYLASLLGVIAETRADVDTDSALLTGDGMERRREAMRLVAYKLARLESHLTVSCRFLNDLRMLRRLLLAERPRKTSEELAVPGISSGPQR
jgi:hypothetical protein